ncbi:tryptophan-rich antigen [Plasmodium gonderi]|uniref:Tryptophan-rich antigen n=1 Tax=Plasmodium gonderi TaxID=77519 RepID=A0A1Y1JEG7_PLAGO|nr:tryptophan-rich antigen [Plasmodium gonderi]GAW79607.1 tryptophan-rich antigen [Plasmodium gonderi]
MDSTENVPQCAVKNVFTSFSPKPSSSTLAANLDEKFAYLFATFVLPLIYFFLNYIFSRSNRCAIEWVKRKQENDESEEDSDEYYDTSEGEENPNEKEFEGKEKHLKEEGTKNTGKPVIEEGKCINKSDLTGMPEDEDELEEWKSNKWKKFMSNLEDEWHLLNLWIEGEKKKWIESKDKELEKWLKEIENNLMQSDTIKKEYQHEFLNNSLENIDEGQIKKQLKSEIKSYIYKNWKYWLGENESHLHTWLIKQWTQWKKKQLHNFKMNEWKYEEDKYWNEWEKNQTMKWLYFNENRKYNIWKNRIANEKKEWDNWVKIKEESVIYNKHKKWTQWIKRKKPIIIKWIESIADKCVEDEKWRTFINEEYDEFTQDEYMEIKEIPKKKNVINKFKSKKKGLNSIFVNYENKLPAIEE